MIIDKPALKKLWQQAFGDPPGFIDGFFAWGFDQSRVRCLYAGDRLAAALYWFDCLWQGRKLAYIYAVATDQDFRGQGMCRRLMEETHSQLLDRGYAGAILLPQEPWLISMYASMGFEPRTTVTENWFPAGGAVKARQVDVAEYAALRRSFLPAGGVVQEGENLRFLSGMARFYAGEDFLAAVAEDGGGLWCPEFLGDPAAAPGLAGMLGFRAGRARMPGGERPFSMFRPLAEDCPSPRYFGLVFD